MHICGGGGTRGVDMDKMTEHKRYYITVPKNAAAEYAYDHGEETKEQIERLILSISFGAV